jgi:ABC-type sugar transport system substrate-binding protein
MPREIHFFYDHLWSGVVDEAQRVGQLGLQFLNRPMQVLGEGDTEAFKQLVESGVDGIILTAGNAKAPTPLIDDAESNGVRIVCGSTDAPESRRSCVVCVDPSLNGSLAGELMGKLVARGSKVAVVAGMLTAEDHRKKTDGFSQSFPRRCVGGKLVRVIAGHEDEDEPLKKLPTSCSGHPTLPGSM